MCTKTAKPSPSDDADTVNDTQKDEVTKIKEGPHNIPFLWSCRASEMLDGEDTLVLPAAVHVVKSSADPEHLAASARQLRAKRSAATRRSIMALARRCWSRRAGSRCDEPDLLALRRAGSSRSATSRIFSLSTVARKETNAKPRNVGPRLADKRADGSPTATRALL